jgi:PAS domain S-box-containing protein
MTFDFSSYSLIFIFMGILVLILAAVIWTRRESPGALPISICLMAIALWLFARTLMTSASFIGDKVFWAKIMYCCTVTVVVMWFSFALDYSGSHWWRKKQNLFLLCFIPAISLIIVSTSGLQHLNWLKVQPYLSGDLILWERAPLFWVVFVYSLILMLTGFGVLFRFGIRNSRNQLFQICILALGTIIAGFALIAHAIGFIGDEQIHLIPYLFFVAGLFYVLTIFRYKFFDVIPQARKALVEHMPDGIVVLNSAGSIADMNPAAEKILKSDRMKVFGKRIDKTFPWLGLSKPENPIGQHNLVECENEGYELLDVRLIPIQVGQKLKGKLLLLRDISEHRKVEKTIRDSELRYRTLVDQSTDGVLIVQDGVFKFANRTFSEISGYPVFEIVGQAVAFVMPENETEVVNKLRSFRTEEKPAAEYFDVRLKRKDGKLREMEAIVSMITFMGHNAYLLTIRDITDRKINQMKIQNLYQQEVLLRKGLQDEIDKRSKYTRALVYELKNPLTEILVSSELLDSLVQEGTQKALVRNMRRASSNLENRINELMELEKGETGKLKINLMPVDLSQLIDQIAREIFPAALNKGLTLEFNIDASLPVIQGDWVRLSQVINNLLTNAVKYTSTGKIVLTARNYDAENVLFEIKDTGKGLDRDQMEYIFDPYRRKPAGGMQFSGIGIGLALCKIYVELHEGKIWVESTYGSGSTFSFTLPISQSSL